MRYCHPVSQGFVITCKMNMPQTFFRLLCWHRHQIKLTLDTKLRIGPGIFFYNVLCIFGILSNTVYFANVHSGGFCIPVDENTMTYGCLAVMTHSHWQLWKKSFLSEKLLRIITLHPMTMWIGIAMAEKSEVFENSSPWEEFGQTPVSCRNLSTAVSTIFAVLRLC